MTRTLFELTCPPLQPRINTVMITTTTTVKTITKSILKVTEKQLKANLIENFKEIFNDYDLADKDSREYYQADFHRLTDLLDQMDKGNFSQVFADGYTPMLLNYEDFEEVENFFHKNSIANSRNGNEFEIHIEDSKTGYDVVVKHVDINY